MMGTLMKGADETGCGSFFERENISLQISMKQPLEEKKTAVCGDNGVSVQGGGSTEGGRRQRAVRTESWEYIESEYHDPDLNISQTGFHFDMTPAYLSAMFKKTDGKSLSSTSTPFGWRRRRSFCPGNQCGGDRREGRLSTAGHLSAFSRNIRELRRGR